MKHIICDDCEEIVYKGDRLWLNTKTDSRIHYLCEMCAPYYRTKRMLGDEYDNIPWKEDVNANIATNENRAGEVHRSNY